jgi:multiple sugar transport system ATP-binding protein
MASVILRNVLKRYDDTEVLRDVNLDIADGEFVVFVGPSGCGKTTLMRMIAGLEDISGGDLTIDGTRMNDVPPAKRGIAMVFQSYALYPHMTLYDNMAFGLKLAGTKKPEIDAAVKNAARILHIDHLLDRKPKQLSGGQRQRVAIGRAITRKPKVFLFDEPLSNLDAALRVKMRLEFARLHDELKTTMIYVTHDQVEDDAGGRDRGALGGQCRAGWQSESSLSLAGEPLCGRVHRLAQDELPRRPDPAGR